VQQCYCLPLPSLHCNSSWCYGMWQSTSCKLALGQLGCAVAPPGIHAYAASMPEGQRAGLLLMLQVVAAAAPGSGDSSAEQLRLENERLREALANRLDAMAPDKARALVEQHRRLRASAGLGGPAPIAAQGTAAPQTVEQGTAPANGSSNVSGSWPLAAADPRVLAGAASACNGHAFIPCWPGLCDFHSASGLFPMTHHCLHSCLTACRGQSRVAAAQTRRKGPGLQVGCGSLVSR
jgi:hypothetical protein